MSINYFVSSLHLVLCSVPWVVLDLCDRVSTVRAQMQRIFRQRSQHTQWNCNVLRMCVDAIFGAQATCLNSSECCVGDMRCTLNSMRRIWNNANHLNYFRDCSLFTVDFRRIVNHEDDSIVIGTVHPRMCFLIYANKVRTNLPLELLFVVESGSLVPMAFSRIIFFTVLMLAPKVRIRFR